jgi:hypothetical protein
LTKYNDQKTKKIDFLIKLGIGDQEHLPYYREVLLDPEKAVRVVRCRDYVSKVLIRLVHMMTEDDILYNRIRSILLRKARKLMPENMSDHALKSLIEKSVESEVPVDVLVDVYQRGFFEEGRQIDPEQNGFNRVNSFLAGGKALDLDRDILDEYYITEQAKDKKKKPRPYNPVLRTVSKVLKNSNLNHTEKTDG